MDLFKKDIKFASNILNDAQEFEIMNVTKEATFKELDRRDKDQHKLHFMLMAIVKFNEEGEILVDSDILYDFTVRAVKVLLVKTDEFTEQDKVEFLQDSAALLQFGQWMLAAKITPFFPILTMK